MCSLQIVILIIAVLTNESQLYNHCEGNLTLFRKNAPLLITKYQQLYVPTSAKLKFRHNEKITLACTGSKNKFSLTDFSGSTALHVTCRNGQYDTTKRNYTSLDLFTCLKDPSTTVLNLESERCANNEGYFKSVVYQFENKIIPLYKSCYNPEKWEAIYTAHNVSGTYWQEVCRMNFVETGLNLPKGIKINPLYTKKCQNETLIKLYGQYFQKYFTTKTFLVRGHLAPAGDFNYCSPQLASHYLFNVVPQWGTFNSGKWLQLENLIRKIVGQNNETFTVFTGTHEILELPDKNNDEKMMYLTEDEKLPVPKYFWKVIYGTKSLAGVAFISLNNIFTNNTNDIQNICNDVCQQLGFTTLGYQTFLTCCDIQEIRKTIFRMSEIPKIKRLLYFK